jgi:hypothetical protein
MKESLKRERKRREDQKVWYAWWGNIRVCIDKARVPRGKETRI